MSHRLLLAQRILHAPNKVSLSLSLHPPLFSAPRWRTRANAGPINCGPLSLALRHCGGRRRRRRRRRRRQRRRQVGDAAGGKLGAQKRGLRHDAGVMPHIFLRLGGRLMPSARFSFKLHLRHAPIAVWLRVQRLRSSLGRAGCSAHAQRGILATAHSKWRTLVAQHPGLDAAPLLLPLPPARRRTDGKVGSRLELLSAVARLPGFLRMLSARHSRCASAV